jgi:hypothetical protein
MTQFQLLVCDGEYEEIKKNCTAPRKFTYNMNSDPPPLIPSSTLNGFRELLLSYLENFNTSLRRLRDIQIYASLSLATVFGKIFFHSGKYLAS